MTRQTLRLTSPYMRGSDVFQAQTLLAAHGHSPDGIDGVFGPRTQAAVLSFQKTALADAPSQWDGVVGPRTWEALEAPPGAQRRTLQLTAPRLFGDDVQQAQTLLEKHGFSPGEIDGIFGPRTHAAVQSFQRNAFPAETAAWNGAVDARTWAALDEAPEDAQTPRTEIGRLIDYLKGEVANGSIYVWGAQGEKDITEAWIRKKETTSKNADRAVAFWKRQVGRGYGGTLRAFDCSGLILYYLNREGLHKGDLSSRGLYAKSEKIDRKELMPGDLVFRHNGVMIHHVGVFIGGGTVIEAKGRDDGVVMRDINASGSAYWNRCGRLTIFGKQDNAND
ncbi:MAG: peptidoglycan-binding protein [Bacillota bacterium]